VEIIQAEMHNLLPMFLTAVALDQNTSGVVRSIAQDLATGNLVVHTSSVSASGEVK
jgi:hypothetical protein